MSFDLSLDTANQIYAWGWRLSVVGALVTAIGVGLLMAGTRVRDHDAEQQLGALNREAADARERAAKLEAKSAELEDSTAKANAEAARANLELQKLKTDRKLAPEQAARIVRKLKQYAGQQYALSVSGDQEAIRFVRDLDKILADSGWIKATALGAVVLPDLNASLSMATEPGLRVQIAPTRENDATFVDMARAVANAFTAEGIFTQPTKVEELAQHPELVQIRVGSKPTD